MAKIDGFDGLCNIEERHILGLVSALSFYAKENLSQVAKKRGWAKGEMLQALAAPLHGITNEYKRAFHFVTPSKKAMTRTGAPASPAIGTYKTTMGLSKDESHDFELTSTATCILNYDLSIPSYALILLSKVGVYNSTKERISNLLTLFCQYAIEHPNEEFSVQDIDKIIATKGNGAYINSRNDIAFNALSISGFISLNENGSFSLNEECLELAQYIAENGESISGPQKGDDDYMGNVNRGILELLTNEMMNIIPLRYKDLLKIKLGNDSSDDIQSPQTSSISSRQVIYYGAPGTGKSHRIKQLIADYKINESTNVFRTTFHPDSDYSTFVGCYKPIKEERTRTEIINGKVSVVKNPDGTDAKESNITYTFIPQAFLKAYIKAYNSPEESVILVIEEINRGNCAQIFGDLFQLLDRKEDGTSEYPIKADDDVRRFLKEGKDEEGNDILVKKEGIANGELSLPSNLYIWATMNTSDQSLFPIDSAFKRRWEWKYIPIANAQKNYVIDVDGNQYDWWSFLDTINVLIEDATHSEDKKLGYFFAKTDNNIISVNTFVSKVIFYLWRSEERRGGKECL